MSDFHDRFAQYAAPIATDGMGTAVTRKRKNEDDIALTAVVGSVDSDIEGGGPGSKTRTKKIKLTVNLSSAAEGGGDPDPRETDTYVVDGEDYVVVQVRKKGNSRAELTCERPRLHRHGKPSEL